MPAPTGTTYMLGRQRVDLHDKGHGPAVLLLHELPGLSRATLNLVDRLVADGYHVYYPRLFGDYGEIKDAISSHKPILAFRFTHDCVSPPERMEHFEHVFGPQMTVMQIDSSPCNAAGVPGNSHAVLTLSHHPSEPHYPTNDAIAALEEFLNRTLRSTH